MLTPAPFDLRCPRPASAMSLDQALPPLSGCPGNRWRAQSARQEARRQHRPWRADSEPAEQHQAALNQATMPEERRSFDVARSVTALKLRASVLCRQLHDWIRHAVLLEEGASTESSPPPPLGGPLAYPLPAYPTPPSRPRGAPPGRLCCPAGGWPAPWTDPPAPAAGAARQGDSRTSRRQARSLYLWYAASQNVLSTAFLNSSKGAAAMRRPAQQEILHCRPVPPGRQRAAADVAQASHLQRQLACGSGARLRRHCIEEDLHAVLRPHIRPAGRRRA